jgi:hypothetical protein
MADLLIAAAAFGTLKGKASSRAARMKDHRLFLRFHESARVERVIVGDLGTVAFRRCQLAQMAEVVDRRHGFVSARPTQTSDGACALAQSSAADGQEDRSWIAVEYTHLLPPPCPPGTTGASFDCSMRSRIPQGERQGCGQ